MARLDNLAQTEIFLDKKDLQRVVAEQNRKIGFVPDPMASARKAQEMALALGIRPEDNLFSCGVIAAPE